MKSRATLLASLLAAAAHCADWPRFLGPADDGSSPEAGLLKEWPAGGPRVLWQREKGAGYASPAISAGVCVIFHGGGGREVIEGLDAATGAEKWRVEYAADYEPQFGAAEGPRSSPVIHAGRVFTSGIAGALHCIELASGRVLWKRDLAAEYELSPVFFGRGGSPLVLDGKLIVPLGTEDGKSLVALDIADGRELWAAKHPWGASYSSPVAATIHGRKCLLAFQGGMDEPPSGGLLIVDAANGAVLASVPHRAKMWASVSVSTPVVFGSRAFISEAYTEGGQCVEIAPDFTTKAAWRAQGFDTYLTTALHYAGHLYGFAGMRQQSAALACVDAATGRELWRDDLGGRFQRGSLIRADGAFLALGENGDLAWLELSPEGVKVREKAQLFDAGETWSPPALSEGRLYICQNQPGSRGTKPRVICYDFRAQ